MKKVSTVPSDFRPGFRATLQQMAGSQSSISLKELAITYKGDVEKMTDILLNKSANSEGGSTTFRKGFTSEPADLFIPVQINAGRKMNTKVMKTIATKEEQRRGMDALGYVVVNTPSVKGLWLAFPDEEDLANN